jgi:hypothetical protein
MPRSETVVAAHLKIYVNGSLMGWATGFQPRIQTPVRKAQGIDTLMTFELMPTGFSASGSLQIVRGRAQGGPEGLGMVAAAKDMLKQKYLTIEVVDRITDSIVFKFTGCTITDQTWMISPKGVVTGALTFEAINYSNDGVTE